MPRMMITSASLLFSTVAFTVATYLFETYLSLRNLRSLKSQGSEASLIAMIKGIAKGKGINVDDKIVKSDKYGADKIRFSMVNATYDLLVFALMVKFKAYKILWDFSGMEGAKGTMAFFLLGVVVGEILGLPSNIVSVAQILIVSCTIAASFVVALSSGAAARAFMH